MGKIWNTIRDTLEIGLVAGTLACYNSEKIGYVKHATNNQLIENLELKNALKSDTLYQTDDRETNVTLNMMSGYVEKAELQQLLDKYGDDQICVDSMSLPDPALYKTIRKIHQKYGNAHIRFRGNYENYEHMVKNIFREPTEKLHKYEHKRARYNFTTNTIHLCNLDSVKLNFTSCESDLQKKYKSIYEMADGQLAPSSIRDEKRYLINNWITELSHVVQNQKIGAVKFGVKAGVVDYINAGLNYDTTYNREGYIEHDAHSTIQPQLIEEFIETYIQESDTTDPKQCFFIAMLYNGYFDNGKVTHRNNELTYRWLNKVAAKRDSEANRIIGEKLMHTYQTLEDSLSEHQKDSLSAIAFSYLARGAKQGSYPSLCVLVESARICYIPKQLSSAIQRQHYMINHHEQYESSYAGFQRDSVREYTILSELYALHHERDKAELYQKKAAEIAADSIKVKK